MYQKYIKRLLDIILSLIAIIITLPIFLITGILVLIFLGRPAIFRQKRPGKKEKIFTMYKFRTMSNKKDKDGNLLPDELRLTKLGKFLRKTSLDEIPEFINILKGDMSFVGPRPQLVRDMVFMSDEIRKRHTVRPGLTGLAQINGRNSIDWDNKFKYDLEYINNITFMTDLIIVIKTFLLFFKKSEKGTNGTELAPDYGDYLLINERIDKNMYEKIMKNYEENYVKGQKKYHIGYTTGVYDMFHIGHLNILKRAKEYCDYLIVGVSTDEVVRSYKNKTPVIPFEERKAIVEAIKYVDEVVAQESMDKMEAWKKIKFNAIFHGDDWKNSTMYNEIEEQLKQVGVDMVFLPHTSGISSTDLVKKIQGTKNNGK